MTATTISASLHDASRMYRAWGYDGRSPLVAMRAYAREHGAAGAFRANGSYLMVYRDGGKLRQRTWAKVSVR